MKENAEKFRALNPCALFAQRADLLDSVHLAHRHLEPQPEHLLGAFAQLLIELGRIQRPEFFRVLLHILLATPFRRARSVWSECRFSPLPAAWLPWRSPDPRLPFRIEFCPDESHKPILPAHLYLYPCGFPPASW